MDTVDLSPLLEQLEDNIDDLEDTLELLLKAPLSETAAKLQLLDRAKLYVSITYAIESILFSFLRLNGVNAKEHPVFRELTRLKQYFEKIKIAENGEVKRELSLNKPAAGRIIKHALAGNEKYDLQRAEQMAKEKARAHIRFGQVPKKRKVDDRDEVTATSTKTSSGNSSSSSSSSSSESESKDAVPEPVESKPATVETADIDQPPKKRRNRLEKKHRDKIQALKVAGVEVGAAEIADIRKEKINSKKRRRQREQQLTEGGGDAAEEETILPSKTSQPPLEPSAAFQALLKGPLPKRDKGKLKSK